MITLGPEHLREAKSLLALALILSAVVCITLVVSGIYLAAHGDTATTDMRLLGASLSTTNVGVVMVFLGVLLFTVTLRSLWVTVLRLMALPANPGATGSTPATGLPPAPPLGDGDGL